MISHILKKVITSKSGLQTVWQIPALRNISEGEVDDVINYRQRNPLGEITKAIFIVD